MRPHTIPPESRRGQNDTLHQVIITVTVDVMIATTTEGVRTKLKIARVDTFIMIAAFCLLFGDTARSVSIPVIVTIATSFGMSVCMEKSKATARIFKKLGLIDLRVGTYFGTHL